MSEILKQLKLLNNEDIVWYIYFFIIIFALFTNKLEKDYLFSKDFQKKKLAQNINTIILIIAFFIYLYFLSVSWKNIQNTKLSLKERRINLERLIVNILFVVAGAIAIYADIDSNSNLDIAIF